MNRSSRLTFVRVIQLDAELFEHPRALRTEEAHRQQHQLALQLEIRALDLLELAADEIHSCARKARTWPSSSPRKHSVLTL